MNGSGMIIPGVESDPIEVWLSFSSSGRVIVRRTNEAGMEQRHEFVLAVDALKHALVLTAAPGGIEAVSGKRGGAQFEITIERIRTG